MYIYTVYYDTLAYISYSWSDSKAKKNPYHNATFPDLPDPPAVSSSPPFSYSRTPSYRFLGASEITPIVGLPSGEDGQPSRNCMYSTILNFIFYFILSYVSNMQIMKLRCLDSASSFRL